MNLKLGSPARTRDGSAASSTPYAFLVAALVVRGIGLGRGDDARLLALVQRSSTPHPRPVESTA